MSGSGAYGRERPGLSRHPERHYRAAMTAKDDKAERLAAALRANLRKRKARARDAQQPVAPPSPDEDEPGR